MGTLHAVMEGCCHGVPFASQLKYICIYFFFLESNQ